MNTQEKHLEKVANTISKKLSSGAYGIKYNKLNDHKHAFDHILIGVFEYLDINFNAYKDIDDTFFEYIIPNITDNVFKSISGNASSYDNSIDGVVFLDRNNLLISGDEPTEVGSIIFYQSKSGTSGSFATDSRTFLSALDNLVLNNNKIISNNVLDKVREVMKSQIDVTYVPLYISLDSVPQMNQSVREIVNPYIDSLNEQEGFDFTLDDYIFNRKTLAKLPSRNTPFADLRMLELNEHPYGNSDLHPYVGFSQIYNYLDFLNSRNSLDDFTLDEGLFSRNIRSNIGNNAVNKDIFNTFVAGPNIFAGDIWWLSNGITIVAKSIKVTGDTVTLENPSIVNGQQTSRQLANAFQKDKTEFLKSNPKFSPWKFMVKIFVGDYDNEHISDLIDQVIVGLNSQSAVNKNSADLVYAETLELQKKFQNDDQILEVKRGEFSQNKNFTKRNDKSNILYIEELIQYALAANFVLDNSDNPVSIGSVRSSKSTIVRMYHKKIFKNQKINLDQLVILGNTISIFKKNIQLTDNEYQSGMGYLTFAIFRIFFMKYKQKSNNNQLIIDKDIYSKITVENIKLIKDVLLSKMIREKNVNWDQKSKTSSFETLLDSIINPKPEILSKMQANSIDNQPT